MKTTLKRWGSSLRLRIPPVIAQRAALEPGSLVELTLDWSGRLIVERLAGPHYQLKDLLAQVTTENLHDNEWRGAARGRETW